MRVRKYAVVSGGEVEVLRKRYLNTSQIRCGEKAEVETKHYGEVVDQCR